MGRLALASALGLGACTPLGGKIDESVSQNHFYGLLKTSVVFGYGGNCIGPGCTEIRGADVQSFRPLGPTYAIDAARAYFETKPLEGETPRGFRALGGPYALGSRGAYYRGSLLPAEGETFEVVRFDGAGVEYYARDRFAVFCRDQKLSRDPSAFRALERRNYFRDGANVYFISGGVCHQFPSSPERFVFLKKPDGSPSSYASDGELVFTVPGTARVPEADAATFTPLCTKDEPKAYAADRARVYVFGRVIPGADPRSFEFPDRCEPPASFLELLRVGDAPP